MRTKLLRPVNLTLANFAIAAVITLLPLTVFSRAQDRSPSNKSWTPPRNVDGQPDIEGTWSNASIIPLERPKELEGKQSLTPAEMAAYEAKVFPRTVRDRPPAAGKVGTYNDFWWDADSVRAPNLRTSIIVDPPDGKVPALTPEALQRVLADRAYAREHPDDGPEDRTLQDRCILFQTSGPPMLPSFYNNVQYGPLTTNYKIVQTPDYVAILVEVNHDARIIPLNGGRHLPANVTQWLGDSIGRWEGNTLVVDTTNFTGKTKFKGADENLHLTERFTRIAPDVLLYQFTVDDPTAFTTSWTGEIPMIANDGPLFEHACHEGNYGLAGILSGARADEQAGLK